MQLTMDAKQECKGETSRVRRNLCLKLLLGSNLSCLHPFVGPVRDLVKGAREGTRIHPALCGVSSPLRYLLIL